MTRLAAGGVVVLAGLLVACATPEPEPRTFFDFMDDGLAREGVLTRCNQNRAATLEDVECVNARRAAAVVALEQERSRSVDFERESERKLIALRERAERDAQADALAATAAQAAARAAYEAQWRGASTPADVGEPVGASAPVFGAPIGVVLPSMSDAAFFEDLAETTRPPTPPTVGAAAMEHPASQVDVAPPQLPREELAVLSRPFRADHRAN